MVRRSWLSFSTMMLLWTLLSSTMVLCAALPKFSSVAASRTIQRVQKLPRGGGDNPAAPSYYYYDENDPNTSTIPPPSNTYGYMPQQESVQDRIDAWKSQQQSAYRDLNSQASPRDADGRVKLLAGVSKGSRALIFFILLWRDVHLYEMADSSLKHGFLRILVVVPLCLLFLANLAGVVTTLTTPNHATKKRLKAILNLDKLVEVVLIVYYFGRLTLFPPKYTLREIYIANTLHSVFFLLQCQACTRLSWDETTTDPASKLGGSTSIGGMQPSGRNPYPAYYGATSSIATPAQQQQQQQQYYYDDDDDDDNNHYNRNDDNGYRY